MREDEPNLVKTTGEVVPFRERKLRSALRRSGAGRRQVERVVGAVRDRLRDGMSTDEVFRISHKALRAEEPPRAARFSLKRAILALGPDGFPFERFVAELWRHDGWRARNGVLLQGRFVRHEIDVEVSRGRDRELGECKFKTQSEGKVDVKVALYVHARALDLENLGFQRFWLITNGRFSKDALAYGKGVGLGMLSWDHPKGDSLRERIDRSGLHPITVITALRAGEQHELLRRGVVLCRQLRERAGVLDELRLSPARKELVLDEIEALCGCG